MLNILKLNKIDSIAEKVLDNYNLVDDCSNPDAILVRSYKMNDMQINSNLLAVGRAGSGTNNVPCLKLQELGIPVFNAPGANANAVKELVVAALVNSSRNFVASAQWCNKLDKTLDIQQYNKSVEAGKKEFAGCEIKGKTLGIIGIGAIGKLVAYAAKDLGMKVIGNDTRMVLPVLSSRKVKRVDNIDKVFQQSDYITIHVPLTPSTKELINKTTIAKMKDGCILLNYSRGEVVNNLDVIEAVKSGKIKKFYCDFPAPEFQGVENIVCTPHLGASTSESETLCAKMASEELKDYIENGNISNSVNFPTLSIERKTNRITVFAKDNADVLPTFTKILANNDINIKNINSEVKDSYIYAMVDTDSNINENVLTELEKTNKFIKIRILK